MGNNSINATEVMSTINSVNKNVSKTKSKEMIYRYNVKHGSHHKKRHKYHHQIRARGNRKKHRKKGLPVENSITIVYKYRDDESYSEPYMINHRLNSHRTRTRT